MIFSGKKGRKLKKSSTLFIAAIMIISLNGCAESSSKSTSVLKNSTVKRENKKIDLKDYDAKGRYREALKLAREWQSDAKLYSVDVYYRIEGDKFTPLNLSYDFGSPKFPEGGYTISTFDYSEELIGNENEALGLMELNSVEVEKWKINSEEAVRIAENTGGRSYRNDKNPDTFSASLHNNPTIIWSTQYYFEKDSSKGMMGIGLNAETGEVIDKY